MNTFITSATPSSSSRDMMAAELRRFRAGEEGEGDEEGDDEGDGL